MDRPWRNCTSRRSVILPPVSSGVFGIDVLHRSLEGVLWARSLASLLGTDLWSTLSLGPVCDWPPGPLVGYPGLGPGAWLLFHGFYFVIAYPR